MTTSRYTQPAARRGFGVLVSPSDATPTGLARLWRSGTRTACRQSWVQSPHDLEALVCHNEVSVGNEGCR